LHLFQLIHRLQNEYHRDKQRTYDQDKREQRRANLQELRTVNRVLKKRRAELNCGEKSRFV
jgi:hypothetical protein